MVKIYLNVWNVRETHMDRIVFFVSDLNYVAILFIYAKKIPQAESRGEGLKHFN